MRFAVVPVFPGLTFAAPVMSFDRIFARCSGSVFESGARHIDIPAAIAVSLTHGGLAARLFFALHHVCKYSALNFAS
jgi:hypothetical protein